MLTSFGVFVKPLLAEFDWGRGAISGAFSLSIVMGGLFGILGGRVSDKFGPRLAVTVGGLFAGAGYLLMSRVGAIWHIQLFYGVLVSIGTGFAAIPLLSVAPRWFTRGRGLASGIVMSGVGVGTVVVPLLANFFISRFSWQTSYLVFGFSCLVLVVTCAQFLRRAPTYRGHGRENNESGINDHKAQAGSRSLREAATNLTFWLIIAMGFVYFFGVQTVLVHVAAHATDIGYSSEAAAAILSVVGFVSIGSTIAGGWLGDFIGNRRTMIVIFALVAASLLGFRFAGDLKMLYLCAFVFGLGYGGFSSVQSPFLADFFGLKDLGVIISLFILAQNVGGALGSLIGGYIYDFKGIYDWAFLLAAILSAAGLFLSLLVRPHPADAPGNRQ